MPFNLIGPHRKCPSLQNPTISPKPKSNGDADGDGVSSTNDERIVDLVRTTPDGHERVEASIGSR